MHVSRLSGICSALTLIEDDLPIVVIVLLVHGGGDVFDLELDLGPASHVAVPHHPDADGTPVLTGRQVGQFEFNAGPLQVVPEEDKTEVNKSHEKEKG